MALWDDWDKVSARFWSDNNPSNEAAWRASQTSFAGCDIQVVVEVQDQGYRTQGEVDWVATNYQQDIVRPPITTVTLAELHTISVSTMRPKAPVRSFGEVNTKGFVRGHRTVSGSMIFSVFNRHALHQIINNSSGKELPTHASYSKTGGFEHILIDQLPPFDVTILFVNESGNIARMALYGVEIESSGQVMSVSDLLTENSVTYRARYLDPMRPILEYGSLVDPDHGNLALIDTLEEAEYAATFEEKQKILERFNTLYHTELKQLYQSTGSTLKEALGYNTLNKNISLQVLAQSRNPFR